MGVSGKAFHSSSGENPCECLCEGDGCESEGCSRYLSVCCSSTLGSVTTGLCPILLFSFILLPYSHKSNSAFSPEIPSGEPPAALTQSRVTTVLQLWQTGVARRFSRLRKLGKGKCFLPVSTSSAVRNVGGGKQSTLLHKYLKYSSS